MTKTKAIARNDGDGVNLDELPDARVTIDLKRVKGGWVAYDPDDDTAIVGRADTGPRAAKDYCRQVAEYLEGAPLSADGERGE